MQALSVDAGWYASFKGVYKTETVADFPLAEHLTLCKKKKKNQSDKNFPQKKRHL